MLLRALGAGDWKLMGALGAFVGPVMLWFVLLAVFWWQAPWPLS